MRLGGLLGRLDSAKIGEESMFVTNHGCVHECSIEVSHAAVCKSL